MRRYLYRPNGLLKVVSMLDSSSRATDQYPCRASTFEKIVLPANLCVNSSNVGVTW